MLGLFVILIASWLALYFIEKKNIEALGILPTVNRLIQFAIGMLFIMSVCAVSIYLETYVLDIKWKPKEIIDYKLILDSTIYHLKSALTEDLIFRGAILYILIKRIGWKPAVLASAICFGIYHVFSYGMVGARIIPIIYVILITGFTGYVWAYTFYKTKSIMLGLGLHFGYNLMMTFFFSSQPYGELLFMEVSRVGLSSDWNNLIFSLIKGLLPSVLTLGFVKFLYRRKLKIIEQRN